MKYYPKYPKMALTPAQLYKAYKEEYFLKMRYLNSYYIKIPQQQ
jgi:hypothetical protein